MLLIRCPYCGSRPELEFRYAGEAHIARPPNPASSSDDEWAAFFFIAQEPEGHASERWRHIHGCAPLLQRACATPSPTSSHDLQGRRAEARRQAAGSCQMSQRFRISERRPPHPGQDRSASPSTASAITASGRHAGFGAARQWRASGRPLVQVSPSARHPVGRRGRAERAGRDLRDGRARRRMCAPPCRSSMTGSSPSRQNRWPSLAFDIGAVNDIAVAAVLGRLLLQDLHVAEGGLEDLYEPIIRAPPASALRPTSPTPTIIRRATRIATCWCVGAGAAGLAAALAAAETGARVILADEQAELGGSLRFETASRSTARPAMRWAQATLARTCARMDNVRCCRAHGVRLLRAEFRRPGRARHRSSAAPGARSAARAAVAGARQARGAGDRRHRAATWCSPTTTAPASCWPVRRAPISTIMASRSAANVGRLHRQ